MTLWKMLFPKKIYCNFMDDSLFWIFPPLRLSQKNITAFGNIYIWKQVFSVMNYQKNTVPSLLMSACMLCSEYHTLVTKQIPTNWPVTSNLRNLTKITLKHILLKYKI
jgi:hypothetical protein